MSPFVEWKRALHEEDIRDVGSIVKRPDSAYDLLYEIYRKSMSH